MKYLCKNILDTESLALEMAMNINEKDIILLSGELGAGKTTFAKALCRALGVTATVTSPTYAFMKEYIGIFRIYHYDMYRAENAADVEELGLGDCLNEAALCIIEWNKYDSFPAEKRVIRVNISKSVSDEWMREFEILCDNGENIITK